MPYFMLSLAQKVPLTGTAEAGAASMTVVQKMHQEFLRNFRAAGLSHVGMTLQYRELLVTGFLLDKGSSSLGTGSQLEWKECKMEPQVSDFPRDTSALAPSRQLPTHQSALKEEEPGTERSNWEPEMELQVLSSNQSKYIFTHIYVCVCMEKF